MDDKSSQLPTETHLRSYALSGQLMLCAVVALLFVFLATVSLHFCLRFNSRRRRNAASSTTPRPMVPFCRRGLHRSLLQSIPTFSYSPAAHPLGLDCPICLSEFEPAQTGRVLPACRHCFHLDCIDTWFRSHSSCPLCRSPVKPTRKNSSGEIVIAIGEHCAGVVVGSGPGGVECVCSATAAALMPVECRKKPVDLVVYPEPPRLVGSMGLVGSVSGTGEGGSGS